VGAGVLLGITLIAVASAFIRQWWVKRVNHQQNLQQSLAGGEESLKMQIDKLPDSVIIQGQEVSLKDSHLIGSSVNRLFRQSLSFKEYLYELMVKDPGKAKEVVGALTDPSTKIEKLENILSKRRGLSTGLGQTRGQALLKALTPKPPTQSVGNPVPDPN